MNLKYSLENEFSKYRILGFHNSLADGVFLDVYKVYPESFNSSFNVRLNVSINEALFDRFKDEWDQIKKSVRLEKAIDRDVSWENVTREYLEFFAGGLSFLNDYSINFYMASWVSLYINNPAVEGTLFSDYLFAILDRRIMNGSDQGLELHTIYLLSKLMNEAWGFSFLFDDAYKILEKRFCD
ncbi:hypothetical protein D0C16_13000 [Cellvibrio sp. KY-GH-1]|uniref:DUF6714 family protein n=1 Tax=Cellvibrio sp. KY-GH-1 TaxID=2303332 RepID=UPI00124769F7|nr:DUF6714 family protein [Cellvibrio sp. KY-GH-1]QEY16807.1 hypothetical protein D0C16_13000 [Cellvibrio sp. KY-GH-1]